MTFELQLFIYSPGLASATEDSSSPSELETATESFPELISGSLVVVVVDASDVDSDGEVVEVVLELSPSSPTFSSSPHSSFFGSSG